MSYNKKEIIDDFKRWSKHRVTGVWKDNIKELMIQFIEDRLVKNLNISDVMHQRELLVAYEMNKQKEVADKYRRKISEMYVDDYLATNSA